MQCVYVFVCLKKFKILKKRTKKRGETAKRSIKQSLAVLEPKQMDPQALQSDCCKARFMLNDILDGCNGNFDYEAKQLRDVFEGENFTTGFFIPQRVAKFLAQKKMA